MALRRLGQMKVGTTAPRICAKVDFLGLHWRIVGSHDSGSVAMRITEAGKHAGLSSSGMPSNAAAYARSFSEAGLAYAEDDAGHPCLSATEIGDGVAIHYSGGLPLDAGVRDWLVSCYAAILKTGIDRDAVRKATWTSIATSRWACRVDVSAGPAVLTSPGSRRF